jgi:hypothetical protein
MMIKNVVRAVAYFLQHPRSGYRSISGLSKRNDAEEFARLLHRSEAGPSPESGSDRRYSSVENPLWEYFETHRQGRGIFKWTHYFEIYHRHLSKFVGRNPHLVEVGIFSGGSLGMWRHYFGQGCHISGIDIREECKVYEDVDTSIYIGDQADRGFWKRFRNEAPKVDVLIDDGGHSPEQQQVTLEEMLPHLNSGGVYLCEDVHGANNAFAPYVHRLADLLNAPDWPQLRESDGVLTSATTSFQENVHSIHFYPYVVVIERMDHSVNGFRAPRHGTEWLPLPSL